MSTKVLVAVAAGGALGAVARYAADSWIHHWVGHGFPWGTLAVNILGSFVLGAVIELSALQWSPGEAGRAFLVIGVLGAFTTFSAFSLDAHILFVRGQAALAGIYIVASVSLGIAGLLSGMALFRQFLG
ncbi:MAG: fluoride efflux transporter CrcB [Rhodospirillales bacterium]